MFVVDTSVVVNGRIAELIRKGEVTGTVIVPNAVIAEIEHQANRGNEIGFAGFSVLRELREFEKEGKIKLELKGKRPTHLEIERAKIGEIDAIIRKLAQEEGATLITGDRVQHEVAVIEGINTMYLKAREVPKEVPFERFFTPDTMSVHLKENTIPLAKTGKPGNVLVKKIGNMKMTTAEMRDMAKDIVEVSKRNMEYYFEIDRRGAMVIQMGQYRVVIAKPPFSDGFEITIVRPITKLSFEDYSMSEKMKERLRKRAVGVIVCGPPGSGKSTFATALAEYYYSQGAVVKTLESPRDLQVIDEITQYAPLEGSFEKTSEILLLVRPDYSVFDEMRKSDDFAVYADMRLAGIGLVGVVHANAPIDAIQRFITRVELGMIPQLIDTIIFIEDGEIGKALELTFMVRVPTGMFEEDLSRPVIEVRDFETGTLEYEIYKFGEETVVFPVKERKAEERGDAGRGEEKLKRVISKLATHPFEVEVRGRKAIVYLDPTDVPLIIGRKGKRIAQIEKETGTRIDIKEI
jgi:ATPase